MSYRPPALSFTAVAAALVLATTGPFAGAADPADSEPPLQISLRLGDELHLGPEGEEVVARVGGRETTLRVTVLPTRVFDNAAGIRLPFPQHFAFEYDRRTSSETMRCWDLKGKECSIGVTEYVGREESPDVTRRRYVESIGGSLVTPLPDDVEVTLGGLTLAASRLLVSVPRSRMDVVALPAAGCVYLLEIRSHLDKDNGISAEAEESLRLLAEGFEVRTEEEAVAAPPPRPADEEPPFSLSVDVGGQVFAVATREEFVVNVAGAPVRALATVLPVRVLLVPGGFGFTYPRRFEYRHDKTTVSETWTVRGSGYICRLTKDWEGATAASSRAGTIEVWKTNHPDHEIREDGEVTLGGKIYPALSLMPGPGYEALVRFVAFETSGGTYGLNIAQRSTRGRTSKDAEEALRLLAETFHLPEG